MRNKKALLTLTELVKLIITVLVVILVFVPLYSCLYNLIVGTPEAEINTLKRLGTEVESLLKTKQELVQRTIPIDLSDDYAIVSFNNVEDMPVKCKKQTCFCLFEIDEIDENIPWVCASFKDVTIKTESPINIIFPGEEYEYDEDKPFTDIFVELIKQETGNKILKINHVYTKAE